MKKLLVVLAGIYSISVFAMPTIAVPDLKIEQRPSVSQDIENPAVSTAVVNTLPKFTADIRGALITSGQFRVVDVKSMNESQDSAEEMDADGTAKLLSNSLFQSKNLDKCRSYVLADMNSTPETSDLSKSMASTLSKIPDFDSKYINQMGESNIDSSNKPECQIEVSVTSKVKRLNGTSNTSYTANVRLTKGSSVLWQQISKANGNSDYYLVGEINYIGENEDSYPIKQTDNMTKQYVVEVGAELRLIRAKDKTVMASFTANGRGNDAKIISTTNFQNTAWHHDIGKIVTQASKDLAADVLQQMQIQFKFTEDSEERERKANEPIVVTDVKVYN